MTCVTYCWGRYIQGLSRETRPVWDGTVGFRSPQAGFCFVLRCDGNGNPIVKLLPPVVMGTENTHLLLTWDGNGTGSWGMFH